MEALESEYQEAQAEQARHLEAEREGRVAAEILTRTGAALTSTLHYEQVLDRVLEQANWLVPHDAANIMLIEGDEARVFRWRGYAQFGGDDLVATRTLDIADTPALRTMKETCRPLVFPSVEDSDGWVRLPESDWIKSYVATPIFDRHRRVVGFLSLNSASPDSFSQADGERLYVLAEQVSDQRNK